MIAAKLHPVSIRQFSGLSDIAKISLAFSRTLPAVDGHQEGKLGSFLVRFRASVRAVIVCQNGDPQQCHRLDQTDAGCMKTGDETLPERGRNGWTAAAAR